jgi:hypothetical protein
LRHECSAYARYYDAKTVDAHPISIPDFARFVSGRLFADVEGPDADGWRPGLIVKTKIMG